MRTILNSIAALMLFATLSLSGGPAEACCPNGACCKSGQCSGKTKTCCPKGDCCKGSSCSHQQ